tara:strand:- start:678 stop:845 length:168 start_codon:yes stop_codon:yes gene_type:complete
MNKKKSKKLKLGNKSNGNNVLNEEIIIKNNPSNLHLFIGTSKMLALAVLHIACSL